MKKIVLLVILITGASSFGQSKSEMQAHYEAFYKEMRLQGDINGVINALTHLNVIAPSQERRDTLSYAYMNNGQHLQALNTVGIENNPNSSDIAVQVKAVSLKTLNQPKRAIEQFEILFQRNPNAYLAYELADLKILTGDTAGAATNIEYGLANAKDDMKHAFYERQQPYEASLKAAFQHLKGLLVFNNDKTKIDEAIGLMDEALKIDPNFNLASLSKQALVSKKNDPEAAKN
ncbi:hypothetical protein [Croceitalea rosinachiae]|uniref:Tetratricopeptide repeat protein n=1 Tax=Croceitalea rosinachiae TaxID=3075596 RepID=A0ABU3A6W6_9FLAO|nr:hypothetical protein [Croceitalea sp. F388]MDT0605919.1 hypothetical protein [Croceitalea sp. F388]